MLVPVDAVLAEGDANAEVDVILFEEDLTVVVNDLAVAPRAVLVEQLLSGHRQGVVLIENEGFVAPAAVGIVFVVEDALLGRHAVVDIEDIGQNLVFEGNVGAHALLPLDAVFAFGQHEESGRCRFRLAAATRTLG